MPFLSGFKYAYFFLIKVILCKNFRFSKGFSDIFYLLSNQKPKKANIHSIHHYIDISAFIHVILVTKSGDCQLNLSLLPPPEPEPLIMIKI